jgi:hypothetical protein
MGVEDRGVEEEVNGALCFVASPLPSPAHGPRFAGRSRRWSPAFFLVVCSLFAC